MPLSTERLSLEMSNASASSARDDGTSAVVIDRGCAPVRKVAGDSGVNAPAQP